MRKASRRPAVLALLAMVTSLLWFTPTAAFADTIPTLQWPAVVTRAYGYMQTTTSPQGDVTVGCDRNATQDLKTYGSTGVVTRQISWATQIGGVNNCIDRPVVDKNGVVYGKPINSSMLLAYQGNTLRWSYDTGCTSGTPAVGADGNIYFISGSMRLIGLTPNVMAPTLQPEKVLDVPVKGSCSQGNLLYAYKDGIAAEWNYGTRLQYISYGGTFLSDAPSSVGYMQRNTSINASGRLFSYAVVAGSGYQSVKVSAWDPMTQSATWSTMASTPGADVQQFRTYPLPGGGVLAVIKEWKMFADNVPATPVEYITNLVTLNAAGAKIRSVKLPNRDSAGNWYGNNYYAVDTTGKVVVVRALTKSLSSSPYQVPITTILVLDAATGSVKYQGKLAGNSANTYGYRVTNLSHAMVVGPNTVYVNTNKCSNDCNTATSYKLWAVKVQGLGMDYPRGEVLSRTARPSALYVALGDSFSSGEGVLPFETTTTIPGVNTCHRSTTAYPHLIAGTGSIPSLGSSGFRACSGAVTTNITDLAQWNEGTQLDLWPDTTTRLVTMTIGGNDIGFRSMIETCAWPANDCSAAFQAANRKVSDLGSVLKSAYTTVLTKAPNARVVIIGYPPMFASGAGCILGPNQTDYPFFDTTRKQLAIDLLDALNRKISDSVAEVQAVSQDYRSRLQFVSATGSSSPFIGHDICSSDPFFYGLILQNATSSFHPNAAGQRAYAELASKAIAQ